MRTAHPEGQRLEAPYPHVSVLQQAEYLSNKFNGDILRFAILRSAYRDELERWRFKEELDGREKSPIIIVPGTISTSFGWSLPSHGLLARFRSRILRSMNGVGWKDGPQNCGKSLSRPRKTLRGVITYICWNIAHIIQQIAVNPAIGVLRTIEA